MNPNYYNQLTKYNNSDQNYHNSDQNYSNSDQDYYDNEENDDKSHIFNDNNQEFLEFKRDVKEWITLDDDILTLQNAIKERRKKKNEITPKIINYMDKNEINDLNTNSGKLKFSKSLQTKPLNKQFLISRLGDFFKDFSKGEKIASYILENRDKAEVVKLRRVQNKKEINV
jgi:hypothetical protein